MGGSTGRSGAFFRETLLTLPVSYLTFAVYHDAPKLATPPCTHTGELTFGSLVTQYKITPAVLDAWAEILRRTHNTRLFLANRTLKSKWNRHYLLEEFQRRGADIGRITLDGPREHYAYLQYYDQIDIALDAFPYNGGTTTMEGPVAGSAGIEPRRGPLGLGAPPSACWRIVR